MCRIKTVGRGGPSYSPCCTITSHRSGWQDPVTSMSLDLPVRDLQQMLMWSKLSPPGYRLLTSIFHTPGYRSWCHGETKCLNVEGHHMEVWRVLSATIRHGYIEVRKKVLLKLLSSLKLSSGKNWTKLAQTPTYLQHYTYSNIHNVHIQKKTSPCWNTPGNRQYMYRAAVKSLARSGRKQARATEDFDVHISYL